MPSVWTLHKISDSTVIHRASHSGIMHANIVLELPVATLVVGGSLPDYPDLATFVGTQIAPNKPTRLSFIKFYASELSSLLGSPQDRRVSQIRGQTVHSFKGIGSLGPLLPVALLFPLTSSKHTFTLAQDSSLLHQIKQAQTSTSSKPSRIFQTIIKMSSATSFFPRAVPAATNIIAVMTFIVVTLCVGFRHAKQ